MKYLCLFQLLVIILSVQAFGVPITYYVATNGSNTNTGLSINQPLATIPAAVTKAVAGDTIYVRGGTYTYTGSTTLITLPAKSGSSLTNRCNLIGYNNERPFLNFSAMTGTSAFGIYITGSYWYVKGFDVKGTPKNGFKITGNYNIIEYCTSFENRDTGVQLSAGASNNRLINCDSYYNADATYGNADGFSPKLDCGTRNYFYGCRSWQNSDDGWDGYVRPAVPVAGKDTMITFIENCWTFMNGYIKNGTMQSGNGNGFKMGGGDKNTDGTISNVDSLRHDMILKNCLSFDNKAKGFDQNNNRGSMTLYNCTGYRNGTYNFSIPGFIRVGDTLSIKNCISLASSGVTLAGVPNPILATNSWPDIPPYTTVATSADFVSIDTTGVRGPRKADGSLPDITFMHLASGSQFIDAGTYVGITFVGKAPDLGCFEAPTPVPVEMTSFTAVMQGTSAILNWTTATETNNAGFQIERSVEGSGVWVAVATVAGAGTSNSPKAYSYEDKNLAPGAYIYRIKQIDNDGTTTIYNPNNLPMVDAGVSNTLKLLGNYPNPFNPTTNIQFSVPQDGYASLKVYNMLGQEVATLFSGNAVAGHYIKVMFNASRYASGIYFARLQYNGKSLVQRMLMTK